MILRAAALAVLMAGAAAAQDAPILSIEFGPDRLSFAPAQILSVQAVLNDTVPYVAVTLAPELQFALASLTLVHVGEVGAVRVCGLVVSEPMLQSPLKTASFLISGGDAPEIRRLAAILQARDCAAGSTS